VAILKHGPLGTFTGPIGNIIGSTWKGKQVIRQKETTERTNFSALQYRQQLKFSLLMKMLQPLTEFLKEGFSQDPSSMTRFNKAFSLNYRSAITGNYPYFQIDYSQVILGRGKLSGAAKISCTSPSAGLLQCTWVNFGNDYNACPDDKAYLVTYCERLNHWSIQMGAADRALCLCSMHDPSLSGETLHVYLGFISKDGRRSSDSLYVEMISLI